MDQTNSGDLDTFRAQMDRIELKLDEVLAFRDAVMTAAAPFMTGKNKMWLALLAKSKGGSRE